MTQSNKRHFPGNLVQTRLILFFRGRSFYKDSVFSSKSRIISVTWSGFKSSSYLRIIPLTYSWSSFLFRISLSHQSSHPNFWVFSAHVLPSFRARASKRPSYFVMNSFICSVIDSTNSSISWSVLSISMLKFFGCLSFSIFRKDTPDLYTAASSFEMSGNRAMLVDRVSTSTERSNIKDLKISQYGDRPRKAICGSRLSPDRMGSWVRTGTSYPIQSLWL